jgi:tRNA threonylcarbamoyladenosine biosynthesis protein TsaB
MPDCWLLIETSGTPLLGISVNGTVTARKELGTGRRHNRELIPAIEGLIREQGIAFTELSGIRVGIGPGSYTGLRIGITAAKTLAYALGRLLVAVPSYSIIANQAASTLPQVDVIGDALNRTIYVQRFGPVDPGTGLRAALDDVHIEELAAYVKSRDPESWISGPGSSTFAEMLPTRWCLPLEMQSPDMPTMERIGRTIPALGRDEMMALEPLYLRGSSAEENRAGSRQRPE